MTFKSYDKIQKQILFKPYQHLWQLEERLLSFTFNNELHIQISVLGKVIQYEEDRAFNNLNGTNTIKAYWKTLLGESVNFGSFCNPEIGNIFIVGALASTFLHEVNEKPLAMFSAGPYGILRGLGAEETDASGYLKMLNSGSYILILRGNKNKIDELLSD